MNYLKTLKKGRIVTPGAKGFNDEGNFTAAYPVDLPVVVISIEGDKVIAMPPRGLHISFHADDIQVEGVDEKWWGIEWERHTHPEKHRWDLVEIIKKHGGKAITDWECGPFPYREFKEFFKKVFLACKTYDLTRDTEFYNALIDLALLMYGEGENLDEVTQDQIDATVFTIYQLLTCQIFAKSGIDWSNLNQEEWLNSLESPEE